MTNDKPRQASVYTPFQWAVSVPLLLRSNKTPDTTAHHVLLVMATHADPDGTNIRPSLATLTRESHLSKQRTTADALARLEAKKLIVRTGELTGGTVVWKLNFELKFDADIASEEFTDRRARELAKQAERNRRYRQRKRDASVERHVTPQGGVTNASVERHVTPQSPSHPQATPATPAPDQPLTSQVTTWGTLPLDPLRPETTQAPPRTDLKLVADQSKTPSTEVDRESPVPHAREQLPEVDLDADPDEIDAAELGELVKELKARDPVEFRNTRFAARRALGIASVTSSPKQREALNRAIYRAYRAGEVTSNA